MKEKLKVGSNRELKMENGKWRMENGEWRMENELSAIAYLKTISACSVCPVRAK